MRGWSVRLCCVLAPGPVPITAARGAGKGPILRWSPTRSLFLPEGEGPVRRADVQGSRVCLSTCKISARRGREGDRRRLAGPAGRFWPVCFLQLKPPPTCWPNRGLFPFLCSH